MCALRCGRSAVACVFLLCICTRAHTRRTHPAPMPSFRMCADPRQRGSAHIPLGRASEGSADLCVHPQFRADEMVEHRIAVGTARFNRKFAQTPERATGSGIGGPMDDSWLEHDAACRAIELPRRRCPLTALLVCVRHFPAITRSCTVIPASPGKVAGLYSRCLWPVPP